MIAGASPFFFIFINQASRNPEVVAMGVKGHGKDKKIIPRRSRPFRRRAHFATAMVSAQPGTSVAAGAMTDLCPSKRGVPWQEFLMACENTQGSTHYYIQLLINITMRYMKSNYEASDGNNFSKGGK